MQTDASNADKAQINEKSTTFPCPACGGKMTFDPKTQQLKCEHCGNTVAVGGEQKPVSTHDFKAAPRQGGDADWQAGQRVIKCESCGAQSVIDEHTTATFCPFCGAPRVIADQSSGGISPETLLPFAIDEAAARDSFKKWVQSRHMAPKALKQSALMGKLTGVYLPHWAFDTNTNSFYSGEAGYHYYVTEHYTEEENGKRVEKTRQVQKTRWEPTSGFISEMFDDVTVPATTHVKRNLIDGVAPFPLDELVTYKPEFVSGFLAEKASVDIDAGWADAKQMLDNRISELCRDDILSRADEARVTNVRTQYKDIAYKQFLLPVWLSSYKFKGQVYQFVINGISGKVKGEAPVSKAKVAIIAAIVILIILAIVYFSKDNSQAAAMAETALNALGTAGGAIL